MEITFIPQWFLARLCADEERRVHLNCVLSAIAVLAALPFLSYLPHICLAQTLLHIPCPGCGITRSLLNLSRLDIQLSWRANPAGVVLALLFGFQIIARPIAFFVPTTSRRIGGTARWLSTATVIALLAVWIERLAKV
jgi:hypothetical protein